MTGVGHCWIGNLKANDAVVLAQIEHQAIAKVLRCVHSLAGLDMQVGGEGLSAAETDCEIGRQVGVLKPTAEGMGMALRACSTS